MPAEQQDSQRNDRGDAQPVRDKASWNTPRLVVHGTVTVQTLAATGPVPPSG
jgi:hypothetical protein